MRKLTEVEEAKALMIEAMEWSVVKWLRQKKRVRQTADRANDALDQLSKHTKTLLNPDLLAAYQALTEPRSERGPSTDPDILAFAKQMKRADDEAYRARTDAENTFDKAEGQLSARMAREGCRKAIHSWELHEKAIRVAERFLPPAKKG